MRELQDEGRVETSRNVRCERSQIETYTHTNTYSSLCPSWWIILTLSLCQRIQTNRQKSRQTLETRLLWSCHGLNRWSPVEFALLRLEQRTQMNVGRQDSSSDLPKFCPRPPTPLSGSPCHLLAMFPLQTLLPLSWDCGLKQKAWWGVLKGLSFPTVIPPAHLTVSIGNANEMYPVWG